MTRPEQQRAGASATTNSSTQATRDMVVNLYLHGPQSDAKAYFTTWPGATEDGWKILDRLLAPVKDFIANGGVPYPPAGMEYKGP